MVLYFSNWVADCIVYHVAMNKADVFRSSFIIEFLYVSIASLSLWLGIRKHNINTILSQHDIIVWHENENSGSVVSFCQTSEKSP